MYVHVDASQIPPVVELCESEEFTAFSVVLSVPPHVWIDPQVITDLAGRAGDGAWEERLAGMVAYASTKGWVDDRGGIRAHVELRSTDGSA